MAGNNVTVDSCNFTNNWAMMYGGAIYSTASNSNITNNLFVNNTVGSDGTKYIKGRTSPVSDYPESMTHIDTAYGHPPPRTIRKATPPA